MANVLLSFLLFSSLILSISCFIIHFVNHLSFQCCLRSKTFINRFQCCLVGKSDTGFFPICYLFYNAITIILSIFIIIQLTHFNDDYNHNFIIYSFIFLCIWESLFNFHRFYSTYFASRKIIELNALQIIFKFCLCFALPFLCIFLFQIHLIHYLYPLIIFYYFSFNLITVWLFGHILIVQYRFVMGRERYLHNIHDDMLHSVYIMRKVSLFQTISSSFYLSLFCILSTDNLKILAFLPIFWCITTLCMLLNFVRNRSFLHVQWSKIKKLCQNNAKIVRTRTATSENPKKIAFRNSTNKILKTKCSTKCTEQAKTAQNEKSDVIVTIDENKVFTEDHTSSTPMSETYNKWITNLKNKIATPLTTEIAVDFNLSPIALPDSGSPSKRTSEPSVKSTRKMSKAMELLGLHNQNSSSSSNKEMYASSAAHRHQAVYSPPRTPMPFVFGHLMLKNRSFPSPPKDISDENGTVSVRGNPKLTLTKISVEYEAEDECNNNVTPKTPKSPFSKKLNEKQSPLLSEHSDEVNADFSVIKMAKIDIDDITLPVIEDPEIESAHNNADGNKDKVDIKQPKSVKSVRFNHQRSASDVTKKSTQHKKKAKKRKSLKLFEKFKIGTPKMAKSDLPPMKEHIDLNRSQSVRQSNGKNGGKVTRFDFNSGEYPDTDILPMFKLLADNGLYSDKKVESAKQLRKYTMK